MRPMDRDGTAAMTDDRIHLVVLFGGQSAEHDVSCITAAPRAARRRPDEVPRSTPVGISTDGRWVIAEGAAARARRRARRLAGPARLRPGPACRPHRCSRRRPPASGPSSFRCCTARSARTARCRGCSSWPTSPTSAAACSARRWHGQGDGEGGRAGGRHPAGPVPLVRASTSCDARLPAALADELGLPVFVKPAEHGFVGRRERRPTTVDELRDAIDVALGYDEWIVVEEAIDGREIEVGGARQPRARGVGARRDRARRRSSTTTRTSTSTTAPTAHPGAPRRGRDRGGATPGAAGVPGAAVRRHGPRRLLLRGEAAAGFLLNEINTIPGLHADLDVPEDVEALGRAVRRTDRPSSSPSPSNATPGAAATPPTDRPNPRLRQDF